VRRRASAVAFALLAVALSSHSADSHTPLPLLSRPLDPVERQELTHRNAQLLLLARVVDVDTSSTDTRPPAERATWGPEYDVALEVVEWLKGGLDGERITVQATATPGTSVVQRLRAADRVDTLAVMVALELRDRRWFVNVRDMAWLEEGVRLVPQRQVRAVRDSFLVARELLTLPSLVARADRIVVAADSTRWNPAHDTEWLRVRVARALKGGDVPSGQALRVRTWAGGEALPGDVFFLREIGGGNYEPLPFVGTIWRFPDPVSFETGPGSTEAAVREYLRSSSK